MMLCISKQSYFRSRGKSKGMPLSKVHARAILRHALQACVCRHVWLRMHRFLPQPRSLPYENHKNSQCSGPDWRAYSLRFCAIPAIAALLIRKSTPVRPSMLATYVTAAYTQASTTSGGCTAAEMQQLISASFSAGLLLKRKLRSLRDL